MRFVITGEWNRNRLLSIVIVWFLLYSIALWVTNALLYFQQMGLTYESVVAYYRGSEAEFLLPRSYKVLLEISHFHLLAMGLFILTLAHLLLFVPIRSRSKFWLVTLCFASAISDEMAGWLTRFVHPVFAYYKIAAFLVLQATLGGMIMAVLIAVVRNAPKTYADDLPRA